VIDKRATLPVGEYLVVLAILVTIGWRGLLTGVELGFVLAIVLFVVNYGRVDLIREVTLGTTYRSNVDRPPAEIDALASLEGQVQILRLDGFVFFGTVSGLLERIRKRVERDPPRYLVIDLRRVTGVDSSAVLAFRKIARIARATGFELIVTDASEPVRRKLEAGGVGTAEGVDYEPDLDRGLERCEDGLLAGATLPAESGPSGWPSRIDAYLDRVELAEGTVLIHQGDAPDDVYLLESGVLRIEHVAPGGARTRLRSIRPNVIVGEVAMYTGVSRTADVIAQTPCVVRRLSKASIARMETEQPELAAELHRWLARTLAERLTTSQLMFESQMD